MAPVVNRAVVMLMVAGLMVAGLMVACGGDAVVSSTTSPPASTTTTTAPGPAAGTLTRHDPITAPRGTRAWRVEYASRSITGGPITVSGLVVAPDTAPPERGYPVISYAHGTTGLADHCAPSRSDSAVELLALLALGGYVVAATDYEGLGTPGPHPYLIGESEGHSVLDAARAARGLSEAGAGGKIVLAGHSQGGHAALFAGALAPSYAPELDIVAVAVSAPPGDLAALLDHTGGVPEYAGFLPLVAHAWGAVHVEARPETILTPAALERIGVVERECAGEVLQAYADGRAVLKADPRTTDPWRRLLEENDASHRRIAAPVLIVQGLQDDLVLPDVTRALQRSLCTAGTAVVLEEYAAADHLTVISLSAFDQLRWIHGRLAGAVPEKACP